MARPYVVTITPPEPLVTLAEVKEALRVEHDDHDNSLTRHIGTASRDIDGPEGWLGRSVGLQTLEAQFDSFDCDLLRLPYGPLVAIVSVKYDDADGIEQTLTADGYTFDPEGVRVAYNESWPSARNRRGAIRVRYLAGYVVDRTASPLVPDVHDDFKDAAILHVQELYDRPAEPDVKALREAQERILNKYRVWSL